MFTRDTYLNRRRSLIAFMAGHGDSGLVFLPGNRESPRTYRDNPYPFRQDSTFLYFVGLAQDSLDVLIDCASGATTLFGQEPSLSDSIWSGRRPSLTDLGALAGIEAIGSTRQLEDELARAMQSGRSIHYLPPWRATTVLRISLLLGKSPEAVQAGVSTDLVRAAVALREIKSDKEIAELEQAVDLSVAMHRAVLAGCRPGMREADIAAIAAGRALVGGGELSFPIIATRHGEVLHNQSRDGVFCAGDLVLVDAGAESPGGYAGDLTTTFPASHSFSPRQRDLYTLLSAVFGAATAGLVPGALMRDVHLAACLRLAQGLVELGLMRGDPDEAVAAGAHALFMPHGVGHMIGLDVHDMENYGEDLVGYDEASGPRSSQFGLRSLRLAKRLLPGMVHSVEPGIYFIPGLIESWRAERHNEAFIDYDQLEGWMGEGGMRLEEDWVMTGTGGRRLGPDFDRSLQAIEAARRMS